MGWVGFVLFLFCFCFVVPCFCFLFFVFCFVLSRFGLFCWSSSLLLSSFSTSRGRGWRPSPPPARKAPVRTLLFVSRVRSSVTAARRFPSKVDKSRSRGFRYFYARTVPTSMCPTFLCKDSPYEYVPSVIIEPPYFEFSGHQDHLYQTMYLMLYSEGKTPV